MERVDDTFESVGMRSSIGVFGSDRVFEMRSVIFLGVWGLVGTVRYPRLYGVV